VAAPGSSLLGASIAPRFATLLLEASSDGQAVRLGGDIQEGLVIDTRLAPLDSIELHAPAEHKLGGTQQDLELVLWVKDATLGPVALSLLFRQGAENAALAPLASSLPPSGSYERKLLKTTLPLQQLIPAGQTLLTYEGSLSAPPCTAGVKRLVLGKVGEISAAQLAQFRKAIPNNARPVQPLGDRTVSAVPLVATSVAPASAPDAGAAKKAPAPASKKSP
jgi:carbonic anhydrase